MTGLRRSSRDESAFYQAEASMLSRENQMLRQRIRDLGESGRFCSGHLSGIFPYFTRRFPRLPRILPLWLTPTERQVSASVASEPLESANETVDKT